MVGFCHKKMPAQGELIKTATTWSYCTLSENTQRLCDCIVRHVAAMRFADKCDFFWQIENSTG